MAFSPLEQIWTLSRSLVTFTDYTFTDSVPTANPSTVSPDVGQSSPLSMAGTTGAHPKSLPNVEYEVEEVDDEVHQLLSKR